MMNAFFLLGTCLLSSWAQADVRDFLEQKREVIRDLDQYNIFPQSITNELAAVRVEVASHFGKQADATRFSAFYDAKNRKIVLNPAADFSGDLTTLVIHESLGAAGFLDVNYENSTAAAELLKDKKKNHLSDSLRAQYRSQLARIRRGHTQDYVLREGREIDQSNSTLDERAEGSSGVVLVGGGGDGKAAEIKQKVLQKYSAAWAKNPGFQKKKFRSMVQGIKIEIVKNRYYNQRIRVKSVWNAKGGYFERIFFVPPGASVNGAVRDIWFFVNFLTSASQSVNWVNEYYIPRNQLELKNFRENPREFIPTGL